MESAFLEFIPWLKCGMIGTELIHLTIRKTSVMKYTPYNNTSVSAEMMDEYFVLIVIQ